MKIILILISAIQAMEVEGTRVEGKEITLFEGHLLEAIVESEQGKTLQEYKRINLIPTKKENSHKMLLLKQAIEEEKLPLLEDIRIVIAGKLHELYLYANSVLCGELVYTDGPEKVIFKIRDLVKNDCFDLSNKDIFGDTADNLLITIDPEMFFHVDNKSIRLLILITPKFLIEEKIETTASHFKPIMEKWNVDQAPIGIFYRMEHWNNLAWFDYLTHKNLEVISKKNLYKNWRLTPHPLASRSVAMVPCACKKFHVYFT